MHLAKQDPAVLYGKVRHQAFCPVKRFDMPFFIDPADLRHGPVGHDVVKKTAVRAKDVTAAVEDVRQKRAAEIVIRAAQRLHVSARGIEDVKHRMLVRTMPFHFGSRHKELRLHRLNGPDRVLFSENRLRFACFRIVYPELIALVMPDRNIVAGKIHFSVQDRDVVHIRERFRDPYEFFRLRIVQINAGAVLRDKARPVQPPRTLVDDLVVLFLFDLFEDLFAFLILRKMKIRIQDVHVPQNKQAAVRKKFHGTGGNRKGKCRRRFAAGHVDTVECRKGISVLAVLLFLLRAAGRKNKIPFVFPVIRPCFAALRQAFCAAVRKKVQVAFVAVFLLIAHGHDKRRLSAVRRNLQR